ncbi:hypothetical protein [Paenibacillus sp. 276b]|uniref:hypothetical protein n=1 Tax=Paenibacillus sp. 276b TaxID=1566277 RepID=UPI00089CAB99|nr:hypothetical protein [Paenibacillus sp. 276b]SEB27492.1 hypothetical protein SAMN03159332_6153 [Paenibacillus sp. 276b]
MGGALTGAEEVFVLLKLLINIFSKKHEHNSDQTELALSIKEVTDTPAEIHTNPFLDKIVYLKNNKVTALPLVYSGKDGVVHLEENRYFEAAQTIYEEFGIGQYISQIEIINGVNKGECQAKVENEDFSITIRLSLFQLGVVEHSGYIYPFTKDRCKQFTDTFAHELFHAKTIVDFIEKYGLKEYRLIADPKISIAKFGWVIMDEYSACRLTAEKYNSYDSHESVERYMNVFGSLAREIISVQQNGVISIQQIGKIINRIVATNYALATRCAFADVSGDTEEHLKVINSIYEPFILRTNMIFQDYFVKQPLSLDQYTEIGFKLMESMLFFMKPSEVKNIVELLFDEQLFSDISV